MYDTDVFAAREAVLKFDLQQIRNAIDEYKSDQNHARNSLHDLVDAQYLKEIPLDPITREQDWVLVRTPSAVRPDQSLPGIVDVQSNLHAPRP
jgi:general secretion pathway protein G